MRPPVPTHDSRGDAPPSIKRPVVTLVVDGSAVRKPGPGGWAALLRHGHRERLISGMAEVRGGRAVLPSSWIIVGRVARTGH